MEFCSILAVKRKSKTPGSRDQMVDPMLASVRKPLFTWYVPFGEIDFPFDT
jgi:hypothetical protein